MWRDEKRDRMLAGHGYVLHCPYIKPVLLYLLYYWKKRVTLSKKVMFI